MIRLSCSRSRVYHTHFFTSFRLGIRFEVEPEVSVICEIWENKDNVAHANKIEEAL